MNFKKKLLAGILGGAMLFSFSTSFAAPAEMTQGDEIYAEESFAHKGDRAKYFSERYGVSSAQIEQAFKNGAHPEDIKQAAILAKLSGKNFSDVLAMKADWPQVAQKLGVTRAQVDEFIKQERTEFFIKKTGLDANTFQSLLKEGYKPHDIAVAAGIAKAANKNVKSVLEKRKINNTWNDVAKSFGVDLKKIMPKDYIHQRHHGHHRSDKNEQA